MGGFLSARRIATWQQGLVTMEQMRGLGYSARQVERGVERGELLRVRRGIYLLGQLLLPYSQEAAAVLVCGRGAVLSHRSAAHLYEMLESAPGPFHVTVPSGRCRRHHDVVAHESPLQPHEIRERHGIPVTSPVRTLIDLAADCTDRALEQATAEAFALRLTTLPSLQRAATAYRGRRGVGRLTRLLTADPRRTRSLPERRLLFAIRRDPDIREPETNVRIHGWEVDFLWRDTGLVVEVDDYSTHSSPWAFERDRRKDAQLRARGLTVQPFTANQVGHDLDFVLSWLRQSA